MVAGMIGHLIQLVQLSVEEEHRSDTEAASNRSQPTEGLSVLENMKRVESATKVLVQVGCSTQHAFLFYF